MEAITSPTAPARITSPMPTGGMYERASFIHPRIAGSSEMYLVRTSTSPSPGSPTGSSVCSHTLVGGQPLRPGGEADLVIDGVHEVSLRCRSGGPRERIVAPMAAGRAWDAIIVGAGHNGLVAATLLGRAGYRVLALERAGHAGGAAVSASPFPGVDVRLSRYSYLVSLFPQALLARARADGDDAPAAGLLLHARRRRRCARLRRRAAHPRVVSAHARHRRAAMRQMQALYAITERLAGPVFGSLTEPLRDRDAFAAELVPDRERMVGAVRAPAGRAAATARSPTTWFGGSSPPTR